MNEIVGYPVTPDSGTSLRKMLKHNLEPFLEKFEGISTAASREHSLEKAMQRMEADWDSIIFNTTIYRDTGEQAVCSVTHPLLHGWSMHVHVHVHIGVSILTSVDDVQTNLDDQIVKTQTMRGSPFIKPFEVRIKAWEERLLKMQDTIDEWLKVNMQLATITPLYIIEPIISRYKPSGYIWSLSFPLRTSWLRCLRKASCFSKWTRIGRK